MKELKHIRNRIQSRHGDRYFSHRNQFDQKGSLWYRLLVTTMTVVLLVLGAMTFVRTPLYDDMLSYASKMVPGMKTSLSTSFLGKWLPFESWFASADALPVSTTNRYETGSLPGYFTNANHEAIALYDGLVVYIGEENGAKWIVVHHDNTLYATYGNLSSVRVKLYDRVMKDNSIGTFDNEIQLEFLYQNEAISYDAALAIDDQ